MLALTSAKPSARLPHTRVAALYELARKLGDGVTMSVHRAEPRSSQLSDALIRLPVGDDRVLIETLIICAQDECAALPKGADYPIVFCVFNTHGAEVARERIRFPGNVVPKSLATRPLDPEEADAAALEEDGAGKSWPSRLHPRESASMYGMLRQGMRHTEAMAGLLVKGNETQAKLIDQLGTRVESLTTKVIMQADHVIEAQQQNRLQEAQARREEVETEAIRTTAALLAEYIPLGLHRITRKWGIAGDSEVDKLLEKLVEDFKPDQIQELTKIFNPSQKAVFAEMWMLVNGRREKRAKEAEDKKKQSAGTVDKMTGTKAPSETDKPSGT